MLDLHEVTELERAYERLLLRRRKKYQFIFITLGVVLIIAAISSAIVYSFNAGRSEIEQQNAAATAAAKAKLARAHEDAEREKINALKQKELAKISAKKLQQPAGASEAELSPSNEHMNDLAKEFLTAMQGEKAAKHEKDQPLNKPAVAASAISDASGLSVMAPTPAEPLQESRAAAKPAPIMQSKPAALAKTTAEAATSDTKEAANLGAKQQAGAQAASNQAAVKQVSALTTPSPAATTPAAAPAIAATSQMAPSAKTPAPQPQAAKPSVGKNVILPLLQLKQLKPAAEHAPSKAVLLAPAANEHLLVKSPIAKSPAAPNASAAQKPADKAPPSKLEQIKTMRPHIIKGIVAPAVLPKQLSSELAAKSPEQKIAALKASFEETGSVYFALDIARAYYAQKNFSAAQKWALQANSIDDDNEDSWLLFARAKYAAGQKSQAISVLKNYLRKNPASTAASELLSQFQ